MSRTTTAAVLACTLSLSGCGHSGPEPLRDGAYRVFSSSTGSVAPDGSMLTIAHGKVALASPSGTSVTSLGEVAPEAVLCPHDGRGTPVRLRAPVTVAGVAFTSPALFGDCGVTSPSRLTVVDLDTPVEALPAFRDWVEFCLVSDPDCPAG